MAVGNPGALVTDLIVRLTHGSSIASSRGDVIITKEKNLWYDILCVSHCKFIMTYECLYIHRINCNYYVLFIGMCFKIRIYLR